MRECGACTACCGWYEIPELSKPQGVVCPHVQSCGCGIYAGRPKMCRDYRCAWIDGAGRAADRPNECGVLIDTRETSGGPVLVARDLGGSTGRKRKAIDRIAEDLDMPCLLVADDDPERVLFVRGPRRAVAALVARRPEMAGLV